MAHGRYILAKMGPRPRKSRVDEFSLSVIEGVEDALLVTDARLGVIAWNGAMERLTGVARADALGRNAEAVLPFFRETALTTHLRRALAGHVVSTDEFSYALPSLGRKGWMRARCVPWRDAAGAVVGVVGFLVDVTDRRRSALFVQAIEAIGQSLTSSLDLDQVLDTIVGKALEVMGAEAALVVSWDGMAPEFRVMRATGRLSREYAKRGVIPVGSGPMSRAILEARPVTTRNILTDSDVRISPERRAQVEREGYKAAAAAPLASKGRVHGALAVHYWTERIFDDDEVAALKLLAESASLAIDNARLYAEALQRAAHLRDLVDVSQAITALETTDAMQRIADAAAGLAPGALAAVHVLDADRRVLRYAANSGPGWEGLPEEFPATAGLPGLVVETRRPVLVIDPVSDQHTLAPEWWRQRPDATYYGVPVATGEAFAGVLGYVSPHGPPSLEVQEVLRLLAAQAAVAVSNAALYGAERRQAARIRALAAVNRRISSALDLDDLLRQISVLAAELTGTRFASFWIADEERRTLTLTSASASEMLEDFAPRVLTYEVGGVGWVARHRVPLVVDDTSADDRVANPTWASRWGLHASAAYPVLAGSELLAVMALGHSEPLSFGVETRDIIDMFLAQAAVAIQNARHYREARRRRDVAEVLTRLARELTASLEVERIAALLARGILELVKVQRAAVLRYEPDDSTLRVIAVAGVAAEPATDFVLRAGEGVAGRAIAERKIVMTPDILADPAIELSAELRERTAAHGFRGAAGIPLLTHERLIGALTLWLEPGRLLSPDELQALEALADQAALAFENARLYASARDSFARLRDTQIQLVHAAKMSALGQLVAGVAHELNNPLSVIVGYGQLLLARELPAAMKRPIEMVVSQADRMAKIVRNLLFFSRQRPPERAALDLNEVIERTLSLRLNQLTLSGISVERDLASGLPAIVGDPNQLEQVFLNLLLNSEQAIHDGKRGARIVVRTSTSEGGRAVKAQVIDDGPGIPGEVLAHVFEPFFTTKEVGTGAGLGLSVSYGIVQEHGGRLVVESRPGATVFTLELPVAPPAELPTAELAVAPPAIQGAGRLALVVEDEPSVRELIVTLLGQTGWRVEVASGGRAGLESVRRRRYDLVVSDVRMPEGGGEEFYRSAVALDGTLRGRFVFITADTANREAFFFLKEAQVPVIDKPFQPALFLDAVRRVTISLTPSTSRG